MVVCDTYEVYTLSMYNAILPQNNELRLTVLNIIFNYNVH